MLEFITIFGLFIISSTLVCVAMRRRLLLRDDRQSESPDGERIEVSKAPSRLYQVHHPGFGKMLTGFLVGIRCVLFRKRNPRSRSVLYQAEYSSPSKRTVDSRRKPGRRKPCPVRIRRDD